MTMRRLFAVALVALLSLQSAQACAQLAAFTRTCVDNAGHMARLPALFAGLGLAEADPSQGPRGPATYQAAAARRLWTARDAAGTQTFAGYAPPGPDRPFEVCWLIARPGESASALLRQLKQLFPQQPGTTETGTATFYGGYERWPVAPDGTTAFLDVTWGIKARPDVGTAELALIRLAPPP